MPSLPHASAHSRLEAPRVRYAPRTGWPLLDAASPFRPGALTALAIPASGAGERLACDLAARAAAAGHSPVWVDGGHGPDVYRLGRAFSEAGLDPHDGLARTRVARAFTAHQLQALVESAAPREVTEATGLVLASDLPSLYLDEDLRPSEARILLTRALSSLQALARRHDVAVVVTHAPGPGAFRGNPPLAHLLATFPDEVIHLHATSEGLAVTFPRRGETLVVQPGRHPQRSLLHYGLQVTHAYA